MDVLEEITPEIRIVTLSRREREELIGKPSELRIVGRFAFPRRIAAANCYLLVEYSDELSAQRAAQSAVKYAGAAPTDSTLERRRSLLRELPAAIHDAIEDSDSPLLKPDLLSFGVLRMSLKAAHGWIGDKVTSQTLRSLGWHYYGRLGVAKEKHQLWGYGKLHSDPKTVATNRVYDTIKPARQLI